MTQDLTKITTPFGLLDVETQAALVAAYKDGQTIQFHTSGGFWKHRYPAPLWFKTKTYRVKPEPVTYSMWSNIYHMSIGCSYPSREDADSAASSSSPLAVLRIDSVDGKLTAHIEEV